jgi:hypothetical protein
MSCIVCLLDITAQSTAIGFAVESKSTTLVETVHNELTQHVIGKCADRVWNLPRQFVAFRCELLQLGHASPSARNGSGKPILLNLQTSHVVQQSKLSWQGTFETTVVDTQVDCGASRNSRAR